jgi:hypothetical protein
VTGCGQPDITGVPNHLKLQDEAGGCSSLECLYMFSLLFLHSHAASISWIDNSFEFLQIHVATRKSSMESFQMKIQFIHKNLTPLMLDCRCYLAKMV